MSIIMSEDEIFLIGSGIFYEALREPNWTDPLWEEWDSENPGPDPGPNWGYHININDAFYYACADCEFVHYTELPELARLVRLYGSNAGSLYWTALKRGYNPIIAKNLHLVEEVSFREQCRLK